MKFAVKLGSKTHKFATFDEAFNFALDNYLDPDKSVRYL